MPNENPERKEGEKRELRRQILEFQTVEKALGGVQEDLNSSSSSKQKNAVVVAHTKIHISHPPGEVVKYKTGNFLKSSSSMAFSVSGDTRVKLSPMAHRRLCESCWRNSSILSWRSSETK